jgi:protein dithiol:quinone oxidoreductase
MADGNEMAIHYRRRALPAEHSTTPGADLSGSSPPTHRHRLHSRMNKILKHRRTQFLSVFVASLLLALASILFSELMALAACPLCIIQRVLYLTLAIVAGIGVAISAKPPAARLVALAMTLIAGTGIFVAGYQVWIQRFAPATNCSPYPTWWEDLIDQAGEIVPILFKASGVCSDPAWQFLDLSLADWSLCWFTLFLLISLYVLMRKR